MEKALDVEEADEEDDLARMLPGMPRSRLMAILMEQAERTDHVDVHMLNGMLNVLAEHGSIDEALAHHAHAYRNKGLVSPFILVVECVPLCVCA